MMAPSQDSSLYDLLEVGSNATIDEIEASYSRIVAYLDAGALAIYSMIDEEDVGRMRSDVDAAFRTLSDPDRRAAYDRVLIDGGSTYPSVLVPEAHSGTSVSVGRVHGDNEETRQPEPPAALSSPPVAAQQSPPLSTPEQKPLTPAPLIPAEDGKRRMRIKPTLDIELTPDTEFSGTLLKRLRESADASLNDVAEITKISKRYLRALEDNDFDALPAAVYVRGFLSEYARVMGLDGQMVTSSFMRLYERYKTGEGE